MDQRTVIADAITGTANAIVDEPRIARLITARM